MRKTHSLNQNTSGVNVHWTMLLEGLFAAPPPPPLLLLLLLAPEDPEPPGGEWEMVMVKLRRFFLSPRKRER